MKIMTFNTQHCASYLNDLKIDFDLFADTIRQSGGLRFSPLAATADPAVISAAFAEAATILEADPDLTLPEHRALSEEIHRLFRIEENTIS